MSKKITCVIPYREDGRDKSISVDIDFISKYCYDLYAELMIGVQKITAIYDEYKILENEVEELRKTRPDNYTEEINKKIQRGKEIDELGKNFDLKGYEEKRWRLLQKILLDNKVKPNQEEYDVIKKELTEAIKLKNDIQKKQKENVLKSLEEREKLFTIAFWEEMVEREQLMDFLGKVINKDIEIIGSKKKM
jgi:hypothetical protein